MNNIKIPVNEPLLNGNERKYLLRCFDEGYISSTGKYINKFELEFAKKVCQNWTENKSKKSYHQKHSKN